MNKIYTLLIISVLGCVSCGDFLEEDLAEALPKYDKAVDVIEGPLMNGMNHTYTLKKIIHG
mgnify:CR=1 FL=1